MSKKASRRQAIEAKLGPAPGEEPQQLLLEEVTLESNEAPVKGRKNKVKSNNRQERSRNGGKRPPVLIVAILVLVLLAVVVLKTSLGTTILEKFAGEEQAPPAQTFSFEDLPNVEGEEPVAQAPQEQEPEFQSEPQLPANEETQPATTDNGSVLASTEAESNTSEKSFFAEIAEKALVKKLLAEFGEEKGIVPYFTQEQNFPNFVTTVVQAVSGFALLAVASIIPLTLLLLARVLWGKKIEKKVGEQVKKAQTSAAKKVERWVGKETADRLMLFFVVMGVLCVILGAVAKDPDTASVLNIGSQLSLGFLVSVGLYQFVGLTESGTKKANEFMGILFSDTVLNVLGFTTLAFVAALFGVLALGLAFPDVMSITNSKLLDTVAAGASRLPEYIRYATGLGLAVGSIIKIREIKKE